MNQIQQSPPKRDTLVPAAITNSILSPAEMVADLRRFVRRACQLQVRLRILNSWALKIDTSQEFSVTVRNISKGGVGFEYSEQLYPDDEVIIDFGNVQLYYLVVRCRRLNGNRFEIGGKLTAPPNS